MPEFHVVSDFRPTGDQPQAIDLLVEGLEKGYKHQTLLGATGTGKSLGYRDPVYVVERCGSATTARVSAIGELVDEAMQGAESGLRQEGNTTILDVHAGPAKYYAQALDPETCQVGLYPIRSFIRHAAPATMYRLQTACGRSATLTSDHNLWVLRAGQLQLVTTSEAQPTDYLPLPDTLLGEGNREALDTLASLAGKRLFVEAPKSILSYVDSQGPALVAQALTECGIQAPYSKLSAIRSGHRGRGIEVSTFLHVLDRTDNLAGDWNATEAHVGGKSPDNRLSAELALTPEFLRLLGYYIAEGTHQRGYVILANRNETIRHDIESALSQLGIPFGVRACSDYQVSSTALAEVLGRLGGSRAQNKHLPDFWPELPAAALGQLLRAYYDGDGTVGKASEVSALTASPRLASDLAYALLRLGIWARITRRWKRASNSQHSGAWYYQVTISGQADLQRFQQAIGFSVSHKRQALQAQLQRTEHSNVDVVPIQGSELRWLRRQLGLSATALGQRSRLSRSAVQLIETDQRRPKRASLVRMLAALQVEATNARNLPADWWPRWTSLHQLCQVRWTPIASIEPCDYQYPYVYDLSVPGVETFLAGTGGFFVHNTYTIAKVVERVQRPALVMAHNKTLAAQLYSEFREFFPTNAVEYFVSYYDYYQPEAYLPRSDTYIEKDADINEEIQKLRLAATEALLTRRDVIIVASVSAIYSIGSPDEYGRDVVELRVGETRRRDSLLRHLVAIYYERNDVAFKRGTFRVRGDTVDIFPAYRDTALRIEFWGDNIERMTEIDPLTGEILEERQAVHIYPAKHFVTRADEMTEAIKDIEAELEQRLAELRAQDKLLEAQRLEQRTLYDIEMMREIGYCSGIENYSLHLSHRKTGDPPWTLLDYFPDDFLLVLDESHMTVPQIRGMYNGDRSRKEVLVEYGFRLPSALDNRPLQFHEFEERMTQVIYTSATPGPYERQVSAQIVDQIIRPTGLVDPEVVVKPTKGQIDDLLGEIRRRVARGERALVTTLTKRMAEDLADYLAELGTKVHYLHSEVQTLERVEILRDLRLGTYDVVVGINLLREGLDLPEVSLVAILDADKEGFLRSDTALIQTIGRAARHVNGQVIMYAEHVTDSMQRAIDETNRRRAVQQKYNEEHGIEPQSIVKQVRDLTDRVRAVAEQKVEYRAEALPRAEVGYLVGELEKQMKEAAANLEFEKAALLRDQIFELRKQLEDEDVPEWEKVWKEGHARRA